MNSEEELLIFNTTDIYWYFVKSTGEHNLGINFAFDPTSLLNRVLLSIYRDRDEG